MRISANLQSLVGATGLSGTALQKILSDASSSGSGKKDSVSISAAGSADATLQSLIKQRSALKESRSDLLSNTLKDGKSVSDIQSQLDSYDEQLEALEDEISQAMVTSLTAQTQTASPLTYTANGTTGAVDRLSSLTALASRYNEVGTAYAAKKQLDRQIGSLQASIDADKARGVTDESKTQALSDLKEQSSGIFARIKTELDQINSAASGAESDDFSEFDLSEIYEKALEDATALYEKYGKTSDDAEESAGTTDEA